MFQNKCSLKNKPLVKLILPLLAVAAGLTLAGFALSRRPVPLSESAHAASSHAHLRPLPTAAQLTALRADETGHIPILMYHSIGAVCRRGDRYDKHGLNIAPQTFRRQLALMYAAHWYPMNMHDILTSHIDAPAGKTPVVITFDDARGTQFRYRSDGTIDPDCAVGILEGFHHQHPDWPLRATFYVLPKSAWNPVPFWQPGLETKKLRCLEADGFEIANHSTTHRLMTHLSSAELCWEMAECYRYVKDRVPKATMDTMALPGGAAPQNLALWNTLLAGHLGRIAYHNRCILMAWGGPSKSWVNKTFDPDRITRLGCGPGWIERALQKMSTGRLRPYISDGNPDTIAVPRAEAALVDMHRLGGAKLIVYGPVIVNGPPSPRVPLARLLAAGRRVTRRG